MPEFSASKIVVKCLLIKSIFFVINLSNLNKKIVIIAIKFFSQPSKSRTVRTPVDLLRNWIARSVSSLTNIANVLIYTNAFSSANNFSHSI